MTDKHKDIRIVSELDFIKNIYLTILFKLIPIHIYKSYKIIIIRFFIAIRSLAIY